MNKIIISPLIKGTCEEIEFEEEITSLPFAEIKIVKPLKVKGKVFKTPHGVLVKANLKGEDKIFCDRCGEDFVRYINQSFFQEYFYKDKARDKEEYEVKAGFVIDNNEIDITEALIEEIFLKDNIHNLCSEKCLGLCEKCGKNLNKGNCSCYTKENKNNPFYKLKELKKEK